MKLVAAMLPADVAAYLESVQVQVAGLEDMTREQLEERLSALRRGLAEGAAALRKADPRGGVIQAPVVAPQATRAVPAPEKKPCGCEEPRKKSLREHVERRAREAAESNRMASVSSEFPSWRSVGEVIAGKIFGGK